MMVYVIQNWMTRIIQNLMIIAYHEKIIQIWMITDMVKNHPFLELDHTCYRGKS